MTDPTDKQACGASPTAVEEVREAARLIRRDIAEHPFPDRQIPVTLLAVADMLDTAADWSARDEPEFEAALAVARAYLSPR